MLLQNRDDLFFGCNACASYGDFPGSDLQGNPTYSMARIAGGRTHFKPELLSEIRNTLNQELVLGSAAFRKQWKPCWVDRLKKSRGAGHEAIARLYIRQK